MTIPVGQQFFGRLDQVSVGVVVHEAHRGRRLAKAKGTSAGPCPIGGGTGCSAFGKCCGLPSAGEGWRGLRRFGSGGWTALAASGRLRPPPAASGRLRPPPALAYHMQWTLLAEPWGRGLVRRVYNTGAWTRPHDRHIPHAALD